MFQFPNIQVALVCLALSSLTFSDALASGEPDNQTETPCFNLVVVAKLVQQQPTPLPHTDDFVMNWPWHLTIAVEKRLAGDEGRKQFSVTATMHTYFNPEIRHFLMFLKRIPTDQYVLVGMDHRVVKDANGQFVIPLAQPLSPDYLSPETFIPGSYMKLLRPVRYRAPDAWWLALPYLDIADGEAKETVYPWGTFKDGRVVADRGLALDDLVNAIPDRRCPL